MSWKERFASLASQVTETVAPIVREALEETTNPDNYLLDEDFAPSEEEEEAGAEEEDEEAEEEENPRWKLAPVQPTKDTLSQQHPPLLSKPLPDEEHSIGKETVGQEIVSKVVEDRTQPSKKHNEEDDDDVEEDTRMRVMENELEELRIRCSGYEEQLIQKGRAEVDFIALEQQLNNRVAELIGQERGWQEELKEIRIAREKEQAEAEKRSMELSQKADQLASQVEGLEVDREDLATQLKDLRELQGSEELHEPGSLTGQRSDTSLNLKEAKGVEERFERDNQAAEIARVSNELQLEAERNSLLEAENSRLKDELGSMRKDETKREDMQQQITQLEEELRSSQTEVNSLKLERSQVEHEAKGTVVAKEEGLLQQLEEVAKEKTLLEQCLANAASEREALTSGWDAEKQQLAQDVEELRTLLKQKDAVLEDASMVSKQLEQAKVDLIEMASEKEALEEIKQRLQGELNAKQKEQGINRSTVSGQLDEIDKLRKNEAVLRSEIASLKDELSLHAESQQHVNKLSAQLAATSADLRVAEADRDRQVIELENLTDALEALENEVLERKRKVQAANRQLTELQQQLDTISAEKTELSAQVKNALEALTTSETTLEEAKQENDRLNSQVRELSELVSLHQDEVNKDKNEKGDTVGSDAPSGAANEQEVLKTRIVKKLLLTYFSNGQANKSQILVLIANVMGMTEEEKEKIGIVGGKVLRTRDQIKDKLDSLLTKSSPIITRVLFGPQEAETKPPVDWDAIEKVASEKTFADLLTEFVANDI